MSTVLENTSAPDLTASPSSPTADAFVNLVKLRTQDLIIGRELHYPIYDMANRLLLSEGNIITDRFIELLRERQIKEIQLHQSDVQTATLANTVNEAEPLEDIFNRELAGQLDSLIDSGGLFVANTGPALKNKLKAHGCKGYNPEYRQELLAQNQATGESLNQMMQTALRGESINGSDVSQIAASYLTFMTRDIDSVMAIAAEAGQDANLARHAINMSLLGMAIGVEMGLDEKNIRTIGLCGLVNDWGMVKIPAALRGAERRLSSAEMLQIKRHPIVALELLQRVSGIPTMVPIICYQVHERPDGTGYPRGRTHNQIHPFARILNVADAYIAMTSERPYRAPLMPYATMECLLRMAQSKTVDPKVVRALLHVLSLFPVGSFVALSDGSSARVLRSNRAEYTRPIVQKLQDRAGNPIAPDDDRGIVDLSQDAIQIVQAVPTPGRNEIGLSEEILTHTRR